MSVLLTVVCPIFAIIVAGFACGRTRLLGPTACFELNRFVVYLALPALLFEAMAEADLAALWQPGFIAAYALGTLLVFGGVVAAGVWRGQPLTDASIDGLNAGYPNTGYIGIPLCQLVFGRQSLVLVTMCAMITISVLFATAIALAEIGLQAERSPRRLGGRVAKALGRNPLVVAPLLGIGWSLLHLPMPGGAAAFLHLLGGAATPCALVSLGLFLAAAPGRHAVPALPDPAASVLVMPALATLKLVGQPAVTALLAYGLFRLAALPAAVAVVTAALPTGTGPFMVAEFYRRDALVTARTILATTVASVLTVSACLSLVGTVR